MQLWHQQPLQSVTKEVVPDELSSHILFLITKSIVNRTFYYPYRIQTEDYRFGCDCLQRSDVEWECSSQCRVQKQETLLQQMSAHKIKRLKTPGKLSQSLKASDSTLITRFSSQEQSAISIIKSCAVDEGVQIALINEINSVYKEIASIKEQLSRELGLSSRLSHQKQELQQLICNLSKDIREVRELYQLQICNHRQLRTFYQQRENEWRSIVDQHRTLLEEYDHKHSTSFSKLQQPLSASILPRQSALKDQQSISSTQSIYRHQDSIDSQLSSKASRKAKGSSLVQPSRSPEKLRPRLDNQEGYFRQVSRLYNEESEFTAKCSKDYLGLVRGQGSNSRKGVRDVEVDDFLDNVIRKTYYRYKEKCMSVSEIEGMEDMKKLKSARTSTRERLIKTLRKLQFQLHSQQEFKLFCQYIEKAVIERQQLFRGDSAFQLLVHKLKECEKLALSSNSEISRIDGEKSKVRQFQTRGSFRRKPSSSDHQISDLMRSSRHSNQPRMLSHTNSELLLNSTIKLVRQREDDSIHNQSASSSSCRLRSELPMESVALLHRSLVASTLPKRLN